jgi:rubrerythrin
VNAGAERESVDSDLTLSDVQVRTYLATSYSAEVEAERFYTKAAQFAQDEKGHQESLTSAHRARFGGPPVYQPSDLPLPDQVQDDTTPLEALRIALAAEQRAQEYYSEAEQSMTDPELKELFGGLVAFERAHEERINKRIKELGE